MRVLGQYLLVALLSPFLALMIGIDVTWTVALLQGRDFLLTGAATLVLVPFMMLLTLIGHSFVPAMVIAVVGTAGNVLALNWEKSYLSPFALPADILLICWDKLKMAADYPIVSLATYTIFFLLMLYLYFIHTDQAHA